MILIPATRPDLVAWLCRFLTTLQLHWWICSCFVWLDTVFLWPVMISYKSSLGAECLWWSLYQLLDLIWKAWLCRFLTTLQLHWWICSCCVWLDTVLLWPVMISYKSSFGAECLWWSLYQLLDLIWWPDSVDSWPRYSCTDEFVRVVSDLTLSCCGQWWYLTNHLSGLNVCDDPYTSY